ncbi:MIZU-KUSSEI-like protein [Actinidia rufa]|uniref:MIZU-KUSSEI-like protein n=1 Tax=Actinidia rufa TaxID=165716 RepID=A0A7J0FNM5_9ERIC|nr:MIZU-KUSSEI-like protein [Actinidia rufa]
MKAITAKSPHDSSFSFSRRYFHWRRKVEDDEEEILTISSSSQTACEKELEVQEFGISVPKLNMLVKAPKKKLSLRSALAVFASKSRSHQHTGLGTRVFGTMFGYRRGHVHFAFQEDPKLTPAFFVELATSTSVLVREMASGLVRIALEKCGYAVRRECGPEEWMVLGRVGPVSMGAGVVPGSGNGSGSGSDGELMYMRAKFERVVGSKDSEAFYMMNPDGHGGPELSIYLLRV